MKPEIEEGMPSNAAIGEGFPYESVEGTAIDPAAALVRRVRLDAAAARSESASGAPETLAKALLAAAGLSEAIRDLDGARNRYEAAHRAAEGNPNPSRGLGRLAERSGDFESAATHATERTELLPAADARRELLLFRAAVELLRLGDAAAAEKTLREAAALTHDDPRIPLARAEAAFVAGRGKEVREILRPLEAAPEGPLGAALLCGGAAACDDDGDPASALARYREAEAIDPTAGPIQGGIARSAVAAGDPGAEAGAWERLASGVPSGAVRTVLLRRAARIRHLAAEDPGAALAGLEDLPSTPAVEAARLDAAEAAADPDAVAKAADALSALVVGPTAAAAWWRAGRGLARAGRDEAAGHSFEKSIAADPGFLPARVELDERLRAEGAPAIAAAYAERGGPDLLRAAAVLLAAPGSGGSAGEGTGVRPLLDRAREVDASTPAADLVAALLAVLADDPSGAAVHLGRLAEAAGDERTANALWLAVADLLERAGGAEGGEGGEGANGGADVRSVYERALAEPAARLALRRRAARFAQHAAEAAHAEAEAATDAATKAAAFMDEGAARERAGDPGAAMQAYGRALATDPGSVRAAAARVRLALSVSDAVAALRDLAEASPSERLAVPFLVRAALRLRDSDRSAANDAIREALAMAPDDVSLAELAASMGAGAEAKARALRNRLDESSDPAAPEAYRWVEVAEALEAAGLHEEAAGLYRRLLDAGHAGPDVQAAFVRALIRADELPAVTEHLLAAVRVAPEGPARAGALERLADFDGVVRGDAASAAIAWSEVQANLPGHSASLRALERHLAGTGRREDVLPILETLAGSTADAEDAAAFARRVARIHRLEEGPPGVDDPALARRVLERTTCRWALLALESEARARGEDEGIATVSGRLAAVTEGASRAGYAVAAGEAYLRLGREADALASFRGALEADPTHPLALLRVAHLAEAAGDFAVAAGALEASGADAGDPVRGGADLFRAAVLTEDRLGDPSRALELLRKALDRNPNHAEGTERAARLLERQGVHHEAEALLGRRIELGGEPQVLARLAEERADLLADMGRHEEALASLKTALGFTPDDIALLWRLADTAAEGGDWGVRESALVQIARRVTDPAEVKTVFLDLGRLYDGEIPDPQRAEASFRRILQHDPNHREALTRLSRIGMVGGNWQLALDATNRLLRLARSPEEKATQLTLLSRIHEEGLGDARRAEHALQEARRVLPTSTEVIEAGAEFFRRQGGGPPLAMWMDLASSTLRDAVGQGPDRPELHRALARVFAGRGQDDAARAAIAVVAALGEATEVERAQLSGYGEAAAALLSDAAISEHVSPPGLPIALRQVFVRLAAAFTSLAPVEPKDYGAGRGDRLPARDPVRALATRLAREAGLRDIEVYALAAGPRRDVALPGDPPALVTARAVLEGADEAEVSFRLGRVAYLARHGLAAPLLLPDTDLGLLLVGLVHLFDPHYPVGDLEEAAVEEAAKRIGRHLSRRDREDVMVIALEVAGARALDPSTIRAAIEATADAAGLVVCGRIDAALRAVAREAGLGTPEAARSPRGTRLLSYAVSDAYFEARKLAGS